MAEAQLFVLGKIKKKNQGEFRYEKLILVPLNQAEVVYQLELKVSSVNQRIKSVKCPKQLSKNIF